MNIYIETTELLRVETKDFLKSLKTITNRLKELYDGKGINNIFLHVTIRKESDTFLEVNIRAKDSEGNCLIRFEANYPKEKK